MATDNSGGGGGGGDGYLTLFCLPKSQHENLLDRAEGSGGSAGGGGSGGNGERNIHINVADGQGNHASSCGSDETKKKKRRLQQSPRKPSAYSPKSYSNKSASQSAATQTDGGDGAVNPSTSTQTLPPPTAPVMRTDGSQTDLAPLRTGSHSEAGTQTLAAPSQTSYAGTQTVPTVPATAAAAATAAIDMATQTGLLAPLLDPTAPSQQPQPAGQGVGEGEGPMGTRKRRRVSPEPTLPDDANASDSDGDTAAADAAAAAAAAATATAASSFDQSSPVSNHVQRAIEHLSQLPAGVGGAGASASAAAAALLQVNPDRRLAVVRPPPSAQRPNQSSAVAAHLRERGGYDFSSLLPRFAPPPPPVPPPLPPPPPSAPLPPPQPPPPGQLALPARPPVLALTGPQHMTGTPSIAAAGQDLQSILKLKTMRGKGRSGKGGTAASASLLLVLLLLLLPTSGFRQELRKMCACPQRALPYPRPYLRPA
jgi:hypothetical protein